LTTGHAYLAAVVVAATALVGVVAPARSDDPAPAQVLPDMRQNVPSDVKIAEVDGTWRLGFASEVTNGGPGYLKITGNGPGDAPMVADQIVQMSDGSTTTVDAVGEMHYVIGGGHEHWHLLDFERYELRSASDPAHTIVKDQKTGFCLTDAFTSDLCGRNQPELTTVSEGISVGGSDKYLGYLEGQYLVLDPTTVPSGDYVLVNRMNPTGALVDADASDDAASVRLAVSWDAGGTPTIQITNSCPASIDCPAPTDPLPDPGSQPTDSAPGAVVPASGPKDVPIVPPADFAPARAKASLSRSMAGRLVFRAIQKSLATPRWLRTTCTRRDVDTFACTSTWRNRKAAKWHGRVRVWYSVSGGRLSWFYDLSARRSPGGRLVVRRARRGSAGRAVFAASGALFCARADSA
jgi:hypothetical protein